MVAKQHLTHWINIKRQKHSWAFLAGTRKNGTEPAQAEACDRTSYKTLSVKLSSIQPGHKTRPRSGKEETLLHCISLM